MDFEVSNAILVHRKQGIVNMSVFNEPYVCQSVHI